VKKKDKRSIPSSSASQDDTVVHEEHATYFVCVLCTSTCTCQLQVHAAIVSLDVNSVLGLLFGL